LTEAKAYSTPYFQQKHLLFQFILSELITTHSTFRLLSDLVGQVNGDVGMLVEPLTGLVGSTQGHLPVVSWVQEGSLTKLKHYCALLCQDLESQQNCIGMHQEAHQAWWISQQLLDVLKPHPQHGKVGSWKLLMKRLTKSIQRLTKLIEKGIWEYREDENVLFFVLRHQEQLDDLYNKRFVHGLLKKMFPKKQNTLESFLVQRYTERGFPHLAEVITTKIRELDKR